MLLLPQPGVGGNGCGNAPREIDPGTGLCLFIIGRSGHFLQAIFFIRTGQFSLSGKAAPVRGGCREEDSVRIYSLCAGCERAIAIIGQGEVTKNEDVYIL